MPHGEIGKQFRVMVEYGMTPLQAIQAATKNARRGAWAAKRTSGRLRWAAYADIVAVDGDPLADVRELESVDAVVKSGKLID
jgi:imidazolonepropionase-like amidohydrolase